MSSAGYQGKTTNDWQDVFGSSEEEGRLSQWGTISGKVVSFDEVKQTATVKPLYRPRHDGQPVDMPDLLEVPVRFPRSGDAALTFPINSETYVELRPRMRSGENWHNDGKDEASDGRSFSLADMEAYVVGGESVGKNPIPNFDKNNAHLRFDKEGQYGIRGSKDGKIAIEGSQGNIYTLIADAVKLAGEGFELLGTEAVLEHREQYALKGQALLEIEAKLRSMAL